jgi:hypothetical protein
MRNGAAAISVAVALAVGGLVGYYGGALGTTTRTTTRGTGLDFISLYDGVSLCSSNCTYPSPYLSGTVLVNASASPLTGLRLLVNGTDEGTVASFTNNTLTNFAYERKASPENPAMPILSGGTYSVLLIATFRDGDTSTASVSTVAGAG